MTKLFNVHHGLKPKDKLNIIHAFFGSLDHNDTPVTSYGDVAKKFGISRSTIVSFIQRLRKHNFDKSLIFRCR